MRKLFPALLLSLVVLFFPPLFAVLFAGMNGMAISFILFFAVNPVYFAALGYFCSLAVKMRWYLPLISAAVYILSMVILFDPTEKLWFIYAGLYLFISIAVGATAAIVKKSKRKENDA